MKMSEVGLEDKTFQFLKEKGFDCEKDYPNGIGLLDEFNSFWDKITSKTMAPAPLILTPAILAARQRIQEDVALGARSSSSLDFEGLVSRYEKDHCVTHGKAIVAIAREHPEAHSAYLQRLNQ